MIGKDRVSERGTITIDKAIRKQLGVKPGMVAYQRAVDGHLEVFVLPHIPQELLSGFFHEEGAPPGPMTGAELEKVVSEAVAEKYQRLADNGA